MQQRPAWADCCRGSDARPLRRPGAQLNGRLYGVASAYDYCGTADGQRTWDARCRGPSAHYQGPFPLLMREIRGPADFGSIFWLQEAAPAGYEHWRFPTYFAAGSPARQDAAAYLASLINTSVPSMDMNHSTAHAEGLPYAL